MIREFLRKVEALLRKDAAVMRRKLLPLLALLALLCTGCIFLCLSVISGALDQPKQISLAVVDKDGSSVSRLAISMVSANDQVADLFTVRNFEDEQAAYDAVYNGDAAAAIIFEEGYMSRVQKGDQSAITVVLHRDFEIYAQLVREFAGTGEVLIKTGEYGVNAAWQPMLDHYGDQDKALWKFNVFSMQFAVKLLELTGSSVDGVILPYSTSAASLVGHYLLCYCVLLLMLIDMLFFDFIRREGDRTLLCRLRSMGIRGSHLLAAKLPLVLGIKALLLIGMLVSMHLMYGLTFTFAGIVAIPAVVIFSSVCGVSLCALLRRSEVGPCLICALALAGLFLCGALVPYDMLPLSVTQWGAYTPLGIGVGMLSPLFGGTPSVVPYLLGAVLCAVLFFAACRHTARLCVKGGDAA